MPVLPCVVQLGFAGSRRLFQVPSDSPESAAFHQEVQKHLEQLLANLRSELTLGEHHFLCGISQIAIGADTVFTRACRTLKLPQRIFLPQHLDAYLDAVGSKGTPDFSAAERDTAKELLASPHIIQERLVSHAADRGLRFEDTNREIVRVSNVVVCLVAEHAQAKPGGSYDLVKLAKARGLPALEIRVRLQDGRPQFDRHWHDKDRFVAPALPPALAGLPSPATGGELPNVAEFAGAVGESVSYLARRYSTFFITAALVIIVTHIFATLFATLVLAGHTAHPEAAPSPVGAPAAAPPTAQSHDVPDWVVLLLSLLLSLELLVLGIGFSVHLVLRFTHPSQTWALARLLAEISRSVRSLGDFHLYLEYLFRLRLPTPLVPLLRTLNVLHLHSTRQFRDAPWEPIRDAYVRIRLTDPNAEKGQIAYYREKGARARRRLGITSFIFLICSLLAIVATLVKLLVLLGAIHLGAWESFAAPALGTLAILLPVLAVGAVSWAAAMDYEARVHTYGEMLQFLETEEKRLQRAVSAREFQTLVEETETRLLGETADWYIRRVFPHAPP